MRTRTPAGRQDSALQDVLKGSAFSALSRRLARAAGSKCLATVDQGRVRGGACAMTVKFGPRFLSFHGLLRVGSNFSTFRAS